MDPSPEDEIRSIEDAIRLLRDGVESRLLSRGWAVTDLEVADDEPLEWFWPPTAPVGYGGLPQPRDHARHRWPETVRERPTPWEVPTRITRTGGAWTVRFGAAIAQQPGAPEVFVDAAALLADLERIECWPMDVDETRRIRASRLWETTTAAARDDHHRALRPTEPYASRIDAISAHLGSRFPDDLGITDPTPPTTPRPRGDLDAQLRLVDAEAWASAVRTARAGGTGWGVDGPEPA